MCSLFRIMVCFVGGIGMFGFIFGIVGVFIFIGCCVVLVVIELVWFDRLVLNGCKGVVGRLSWVWMVVVMCNRFVFKFVVG